MLLYGRRRVAARRAKVKLNGRRCAQACRSFPRCNASFQGPRMCGIITECCKSDFESSEAKFVVAAHAPLE